MSAETMAVSGPRNKVLPPQQRVVILQPVAKPNGRSSETSVQTSVTTPGRNGGTLRRGGGNPRRTGGRTPSIVRDGFRKNLPATERRLRKRVLEIERLVADRIVKALAVGKTLDHEVLMSDQERLFAAERSLAEFQAKYSLGITKTETDTDGNDVQRPGRLTPDESKSRLTELLRN